ncbi:MAG: GWxTD domain-containing protein, partial [Bacteroidales bacterium]|nr:GWxTD domain-containing protein [Bacteroidales bacterium]
MKKVLYSSFFIILFLGACYTANKLSYFNFAYLYNKKNNFTNLENIVFNTSDSLSIVYLKVNLHDLLYDKAENEKNFKANFKIYYELYSSYESKSILDSSSFVYVDSLNYGIETEMIANFDVKAEFPGNYILYIILSDLNKKQSYSTVVNIYKESPNSRQNFLVKADDELPVFKNFISEEQKIKIISNNPNAKEIIVRYYNRQFFIAKPPFIYDKDKIFHFKADSIFTIKINTNNETGFLQLHKKGFYHFQIDSTAREGLTLFRFYDGFPEITTPSQALLPLRYFTTKKEFDIMRSHEDLKTAIDSFWLERAGNSQRAKAMIQKYYNRVQDANIFFTSYQEGWRTDRGIIYIIYGEPNYVYKKTDVEEWTYGEAGN